MKTNEDIRTLLITKNGGEEYQIDIPASWKITFGPAVTGCEKGTVGRIPMALRVYEGKELQRLIITDVTSFRDMSIPMRMKKTKTQEKEGFMECEGIRKRTTFQATTSEWVDADETPGATPPLLEMPEDKELFGE